MPDPSTTTTLTTTALPPLPPPGAGDEREEELLARIAVLESDVHARDATIAKLRNRVKEDASAIRYAVDVGNSQAARADACEASLSSLRARLARAEAIEGKAKAAFRAWYKATSLKDCHYEMCVLNEALAAPSLTPDRAERRSPENNVGCPSRIPPAVWGQEPCTDCGTSFWYPNTECQRCVDRANAVGQMGSRKLKVEKPSPTPDRAMDPDGTGTPDGNHTHGEFVAWADVRNGDRAERCECCLRCNCYNMQCPRCVERYNNVASDSGDRAERERGDHSRPHCTHEAALEQAMGTIAELREQVDLARSEVERSDKVYASLRAELAQANADVVAKHNAANRVIADLRRQLAAVAERERRLVEGARLVGVWAECNKRSLVSTDNRWTRELAAALAAYPTPEPAPTEDQP